jgi:hypothetical protein
MPPYRRPAAAEFAGARARIGEAELGEDRELTVLFIAMGGNGSVEP